MESRNVTPVPNGWGSTMLDRPIWMTCSISERWSRKELYLLRHIIRADVEGDPNTLVFLSLVVGVRADEADVLFDESVERWSEIPLASLAAFFEGWESFDMAGIEEKLLSSNDSRQSREWLYWISFMSRNPIGIQSRIFRPAAIRTW